MADTDVVLARIVITRVLTEGGIADRVDTYGEDGDELRLVESLGLLRLAEINLTSCYEMDDE